MPQVSVDARGALHEGLEIERQRLLQIEDENAKLKKHLADRILEASALRELLPKMVGTAA